MNKHSPGVSETAEVELAPVAGPWGLGLEKFRSGANVVPKNPVKRRQHVLIPASAVHLRSSLTYNSHSPKGPRRPAISARLARRLGSRGSVRCPSVGAAPALNAMSNFSSSSLWGGLGALEGGAVAAVRAVSQVPMILLGWEVAAGQLMGPDRGVVDSRGRDGVP